MKSRLIKAAAFAVAAFSSVLLLSEPQIAHAQKGIFKNKLKAGEPAPPATEKPLTADESAFFEKKIRPVLVEKCYSCHTAETPKGAKGGLVLDTKAGMLKGGESGPAVIAGNAKKSPIFKAMKGDEFNEMPPKDKLSADVIADFEKWIAMGAPDPRTGKAGATSKPIDIAKGREHWAFQPVKGSPDSLPSSARQVDAFVLKTLADKSLTPAAPADKPTLLRRIYFDLVGLPPTPDQLDAFLKDTSAKAVERVIDELLASPQFGERWGRHWLDVARYAESSGKETNIVYPFAWRYRDYVIAAFNKDKPYDQFLKEQLAGDLLPAKNDTEKAEYLIATGYLALGAKSHNERNARQFQLDVADEQIDAFSQGMLGITVSCARCHDHKFDPIPTKDYYALAGIFTSTETKYGTARTVGSIQTAPLVELPANAEVPVGTMLTKAEVEKLKTRQTDLKKQREDAIEAGKKEMQPNIRLLGITAQLSTVEKQLGYYDADGNPKKMAMGVSDRNFARDIPVLNRGELSKPGETVPRGFAQVIGPAAPKIKSGSGRLELAEWVASPANPLTARVYVNRIWGHLFGQGLVASTENFGTAGQKPTHPELLDYLAGQLVKKGWSTKAIIKELMLSRTYQQASTHNETNAATDPDNDYLWRMSKRRLDAEAIRDAMLAVSGELDKSAPTGSPLQKFEGPTQQLGRFGGLGNLNENAKRSVYLPILRDLTPEALDHFDFPDASLVSGHRDDTSVPSQALYLMNNSSVMKLAEKGAEKLIAKYLSPTERIEAAFKLAFGRGASKTEAKAAEQFLAKMQKSGGQKAAWSALLQALYGTAEFRYLD